MDIYFGCKANIYIPVSTFALSMSSNIFLIIDALKMNNVKGQDIFKSGPRQKWFVSASLNRQVETFKKRFLSEDRQFPYV